MTPLTWLYVPADRPERVHKALASGAHAVIVDLEDAVAPEAKPAARSNLALLFESEPSVRVHIRVNGLETSWGEQDLEAVSTLPVHGVTLPKTQSSGEAERAGQLIGGRLVLHCLIESALGVEHAFEIASHERVAGISLGEADLRSDIGGGNAALDWARSRVINAAVAAGLPRPPQSVFTDIANLPGLAESCARGRELGFLGRTAIHPSQLPVIEQAYLPTSAELARAREILTAAAAHTEGGFALEGRFIDAPIVAAATQLVALADRHGTRRA